MIELIQQRLDGYRTTNPVEEQQAIKEILQEVTLYNLWRAGFFEVAAFQGGTSLRILHGLPRFSEDLDFILKVPDPDFKWYPYLEKLLSGLQEFGLHSEALDRSRMDRRVKKALLKDNSVCNQLDLAFYRGSEHQKLKIKLEIDVDPPEGSGFDYTYLDFPLDFEVCHQDLSSNFSLKVHALLCRPYIKGRDWYDFNWYVKQNIQPNYAHLQAALYQYGSWEHQVLMVNREWLIHALLEKAAAIDWTMAADDVVHFLNTADQQSLQLWSNRFFRSKIERL
ncbi:MAG: nucleotidyl transferase AbiEii/AbiGii toxin family protein [Candidatus Thiodiazotropha sp.]